MTQQRTIGAVIVAAGKGLRLGGGTPKQFRNLDGVPMYVRSLKAFWDHPQVAEVVLVVDEAHVVACWEELAGIGLSVAGNDRATVAETKSTGDEPETKLVVTAGGKERPDSVQAGLAALSEDVRYVLVHDGARPYVTSRVIDRVIETMLHSGTAIPTIPPTDTLRTREHTLNRAELFAVQTPQGFRRDMLQQAYEEAAQTGFAGTDDASYVEQLGITVSLCEGDPANIKITTKEDLPMNQRIGTGFDVHRFGDPADSTGTTGAGGFDGNIVIGGVKIPYTKPLLAHSDGDVLVHAVMDALLGAAALGDIGHLFPDSDPAYKGADSIALLAKVGEKLTEAGYHIGNIDAILMGEEPKFAPHEEAMIENMAKALGISPGQISVKATTTEKLGFLGRGEGLAAQAVCLIIGN